MEFVEWCMGFIAIAGGIAMISLTALIIKEIIWGVI